MFWSSQNCGHDEAHRYHLKPRGGCKRENAACESTGLGGEPSSLERDERRALRLVALPFDAWWIVGNPGRGLRDVRWTNLQDGGRHHLVALVSFEPLWHTPHALPQLDLSEPKHSLSGPCRCALFHSPIQPLDRRGKGLCQPCVAEVTPDHQLFCVHLF